VHLHGRQLRPDRLCLADRAFDGCELWRAATAPGADLLWRVKHNLRLPRETVLADGSYLTTVYPSDKHRRHRTGGVRVRVVEYRLEGVAGAEPLYRLFNETLEAAGIRYLDAPCTGSKAGAEGGTLTVMIGGDKTIFEQTKPIFELMGKQFYYCGGPGLGLQAKLTQNLILANIMQAFNEGIVLAAKGGVDPKTMYEILDNSAAKSGLISGKAPKIFKRDFTTHFSTKWMHKDVSMALDAARSLGIPLPVTAVTQQMFQAAISGGNADADFCSTVQTMEKLAGIEVKG